MQEERRPDLNTPEESALERQVDQLLDPNIPDPAPSAPLAPKEATPVVVKPAKKILITHADAAEPTTAPEVPGKRAPKEPVKIAVAHVEAEPAKPNDELNEAVMEANAALASKLGVDNVAKAESAPASVVADEAEADLVEGPAEVDKAAEPEPSVVPETPQPVPEAPEPSTPVEIGDEELTDTYADTETEKAVDEIVSEEGSELLQDQDQTTEASDDEPLDEPVELDEPLEKKPRKHRSFWGSIGGFFADWWHSKLARWVTILIILGLIGAAAVMPTTRYYALNVAGVRSSATVQVMDQSTLQPLKNVQVQLAGQSGLTNSQGTVTLSKLRLGPTVLMIQKTAFAPITEHVILGWGSNPLGSRSIAPTGNQYAFLVTDFLSGKPIAKADASLGQYDAISDDKGQIRLTLDHRTDATAQVAITADGYRAETVTLDLTSTQTTPVKLVPARKEVFITKRSGTYDVYKVDIDGKNEQLVLAGTGYEQDNMTLLPNTTDEVTALVSTRDNLHNADGFLLSTLTMINMNDNSTHTVAQSEQVQIVGWIGERLIYVQIAAGASAASPSRVRLMSYDYKTQDNKQITSTNYFNDVMVVGSKIYYAPSSTYQPAGVPVNFYAINADGSGKQTVLGWETWNAFRTAYDHIVLSVPNQWYDYTIGGGAPAKLDGQPANLTSRVYVDSPDGKQSAWVDNRDGKGTLMVYDVAAKTDKVVQAQAGLSLPVRWLNNTTIIYRIHSDQETADYAVSTDGGSPVKITDVTNTNGIDKWYYY